MQIPVLWGVVVKKKNTKLETKNCLGSFSGLQKGPMQAGPERLQKGPVQARGQELMLH